MNIILPICQVLVALGLLNVWLVRFNKPTSFRGGSAANMREEFAAYGLPAWSCFAVGFLKITAAICLLAGLAFAPLVLPAAAVVAVLMVGAVGMHIRVGDPPRKALPAVIVLVLCLVICAGHLPF